MAEQKENLKENFNLEEFKLQMLEEKMNKKAEAKKSKLKVDSIFVMNKKEILVFLLYASIGFFYFLVVQ